MHSSVCVLFLLIIYSSLVLQLFSLYCDQTTATGTNLCTGTNAHMLLCGDWRFCWNTVTLGLDPYSILFMLYVLAHKTNLKDWHRPPEVLPHVIWANAELHVCFKSAEGLKTTFTWINNDQHLLYISKFFEKLLYLLNMYAKSHLIFLVFSFTSRQNMMKGTLHRLQNHPRLQNSLFALLLYML